MVSVKDPQETSNEDQKAQQDQRDDELRTDSDRLEAPAHQFTDWASI